MHLFRTALAATAIGIAGCNQSSPPAVAVAPATVDEPAPVPLRAVDGSTNTDEVDANSREPVRDGSSFSFPDDAGGKVLAKTLPPAAPPPTPAAAPQAPRGRPSPGLLDGPPLPATSPPVGRLPLPAAKPARPVALPERVPPDLGGRYPDLPPRPELPAGPLVRHEGPDASKPAELPLLSARPVPDRAPLTDPTLEFTARSVVSDVLPLRSTPAGFLRIDLPDPFEHAAAARPRTPVVEDPNRSLATPRP